VSETGTGQRGQPPRTPTCTRNPVAVRGYAIPGSSKQVPPLGGRNVTTGEASRGERERCAQMQMAKAVLLVLIAVKAIVEIVLHVAKH
jgi:hypothetical protein